MGRIVPPAPWEKWPQRKSWCDSLYNKFNLKGKPMSEWITDRLPTVKDANAWAQVWVTDDYENVYATSFVNLSVGTPWQKIVSPKPYVKPQRWKPNVNEIYFSVVSHCVLNIAWVGTYHDHDRYASGNCFQTEAQAQEAASRVRDLLLNYHKELNNE